MATIPKNHVNRAGLAKICKVDRSVISKMVKCGKLPDSKFFNLSNKHTKQVIRAYTKGYGTKAVPKIAHIPTIKKPKLAISKKLTKKVAKKTTRKTSRKKPKTQTQTTKAREKSLCDARKIIAEIEEAEGTLTEEQLLSMGFAEQIEKIEEDLRVKAVLETNAGARKILMQTLESIEKIKKLKISNQQAQDQVVPQEQVIWFFSKYFNSLNDDLLEMPESGLAGKILVDIRKLENRKDIITTLRQMVSDIAISPKNKHDEIIREASKVLSPKSADREIEISVTRLFQAEITKRIENTKKAITGHKFLAGGE